MIAHARIKQLASKKYELYQRRIKICINRSMEHKQNTDVATYLQTIAYDLDDFLCTKYFKYENSLKRYSYYCYFIKT